MENNGRNSSLQGFNDLWSYWMATFTAIEWTQEQVEKMLTKYVEQSQLIRKETRKVLEDTGKQVRENQGQFQKLMVDNVENILKNQWGLITKTQQEEIQSKLDELTTKLNSWRN